jgi:glyoxylase-like metal-dependent hydrolase (beta-lactamase superfamily II)
MQKIGRDVYVETTFPGVTVGAVVTPEGLVCIDTPTHPADARRWRLKLAQISQKPIKFVVNLDHHRDRVLNNQWFEAPVIAHELAYERVRLLPELYKAGAPEVGSDSERADELAGLRTIAPQITFADRLSLAVGGHEIHLVHRPGVTPGAIWVELPKEDAVFVGDAVAHRVPPILQDADVDAWLERLAELRKKKSPGKVIVPGRGGLTNKDGVKQTENFLKLARRRVEALVRAKKSRLEVGRVAHDLLGQFHMPADLREHYTRRLRVGLEHLYDSLMVGALVR